MITGCATPEGTSAYKSRFPQFAEGHFRESQKLWCSSIGIGSYLGEPDDATDALYEQALKKALLSGINVMDSAINYRCQRSERVFGRGLAGLVRENKIRREEIIVCTKGGFIPFDQDYPPDAALYYEETFLETGLLKPEDVAEGCHAMTPRYLEDQLTRSLANLGLETIDIYYLHNPEMQLDAVDRREFIKRIQAVFEWLESKVKEGKIRMFGTATWNGYRQTPEMPGYLSLQELMLAARETGGADHHFRALQLPVNLAMPEGWIFPNQRFGPGTVPLLQAAARQGLFVAGSASLLQSKLAGKLPDFLAGAFPGLNKSSQIALQFARSVPGVTTALVGMKNSAHVDENLETAKVAPAKEEELILLFQKAED